MEMNMTKPGDIEIENICIECGLCCDGSMFRHTRIDKNDDLTFLQQMGCEFIDIDDKNFFSLPCMGQDGKLCSLYNDIRRFKVCKAFKCKLLKQYLSCEISYCAAMDVIRPIVILRQSVKAFFEILHPEYNSSTQSIFSFIRELNLSGKLTDQSFRKKYAKQILDCFIFRELLQKNFYREKSKAAEGEKI